MQDEPHPDSSSDSGDTAEAPQPVPAKNGFAAELLDELNRRTGNYGRYEHEVMIDKGGQGEVWRVRDADLDRRLAMKVLPRLVGQEGVESLSPSALRKLNLFLEEARVTGRLDHPGIVPVHELGLSPQGWVYFTMKLVKGKDLQKILKYVREGSEEWTLARVAGVLVRVCDAVAYAHSKQVVHRDLKPANIMVGRYGEVYVMDWGLARVLGEPSGAGGEQEGEDPSSISVIESHWRDRASGEPGAPGLTRDGDAVGTPYYMPPEQANGELHLVDERADVYALGAVLYHLLAGRPPYSRPGKTIPQALVLLQVQQGPPDRLAEVAPGAPPELVAICEKAMARSMERRYRNVSRLGEELRAYLERRVVGAYETGVVAELKKWYLRHRGWASVVAALVLALFTAIVLAIVFLAQEKAAAEEAKETAEQEADRAEAATTQYEQLADQEHIRDLHRATHDLPAAYTAEAQEQHEQWLLKCRELQARRELHQREYGKLTPLWYLGLLSEEKKWQRRELKDLLEDLAELKREQDLLDQHLAFGREVEWWTRECDHARRAWQIAIEAIREHDDYSFDIKPQVGLLPVGEDPDSELWEFVVLHTARGDFQEAWREGKIDLYDTRKRAGEEPLRPQDVGGAMLLVLIPAGTLEVGAQRENEDDPRYDPLASPDEHPRVFVPGTKVADQERRPIEAVDLDRFFLSKYEMTQEQWLRVTALAPSNFQALNPELVSPELGHPVENVSWTDCRRALAWIHLDFPTEAQWEYGARAGTDTPWWPGKDIKDLEGVGNLSDRHAEKTQPSWVAYEMDLDDGYANHAPVGTFGPNDFGLYDVIGNVSEWCHDRYAHYGSVPAEPGDGLRDDPEQECRVFRGGSFSGMARGARSSYRDAQRPEDKRYDRGVRPARKLDE